MATATIQFVISATTINPPTPDFPKRVPGNLPQSVQRAMGGRVSSITRGSTVITTHILAWNDMPDSDFTTLRNFINNTAEGAKNTISYTDEEAVALSLRYLKGLEGARQRDYDAWKLELHFAEV